MGMKELRILPEQTLKERHLRFGITLPEVVLPDVVAEVPEKVIVELETVNFYPLDPRGTNLIFRAKR